VALSDVHPTSERLAQYADRTLTPAERLEVERHLADCARCRQILTGMVSAMATEQPDTVRLWDEDEPFRFRGWVIGVATGLAAAALIVLAIRIVRPQWLGFDTGPSLDELIAAVEKEQHRPVDGRLRGFKYAPRPSATRGPGDQSHYSADVRIAAAMLERELVKRPDRQADLGVVYLVVGEVDRAIAVLTRAVERQPDNPFVQNDLSVAYIARFQRTGQGGDAGNALKAATRALEEMPSLREAAFNRALSLDLLEQNGPPRLPPLPQASAEAAASVWREYIASGPRDAWTDEAEQRLQQRPQSRTLNDAPTVL
jgi:tetratricopeptide (TPR) repeat protein